MLMKPVQAARNTDEDEPRSRDRSPPGLLWSGALVCEHQRWLRDCGNPYELRIDLRGPAKWRRCEPIAGDPSPRWTDGRHPRRPEYGYQHPEGPGFFLACGERWARGRSRRTVRSAVEQGAVQVRVSSRSCWRGGLEPGARVIAGRISKADARAHACLSLSVAEHQSLVVPSCRSPDPVADTRNPADERTGKPRFRTSVQIVGTQVGKGYVDQ
jgi:hypothetical protein